MNGDLCAHEELAVGWAMHSLEPDDEAVARDHVPTCDTCQRTVQATQEVLAGIGGAVPQEQPPPRLRAKLMEQIEHIPQEVPAAQHTPRHAAPIPLRPQHRRRTGRVLLAAAAALAVLAGAGYLGVRVNQLSDQVTASEARTNDLNKALSLAADPATNRAILRTGSGDEVAVVLSNPTSGAVLPSNLKPNDSGHVYVVWGASTKAPVPLAVFDVRAGSTDPQLLAWSSDAHKHTTFAVSLEPGRQAPPKPSEVLAGGQVAPA
ncbi:anti-sigma factor [Lentzea albidocapillata]|uniref:Regulator of SigK n=1 Tax=Lentzea albidocapillata TaxID=40571 RepID=A0A1W2FN16_9PSEU|nr:anti-sigma factor [Lentzea albidocapillata]SMD23026.1 Anti-sigma-K factor rskA [Lentzea albidocapillata]